MKLVTTILAATAATVTAVGVIFAAPEDSAAPPTPGSSQSVEVQTVGRTNVHSDGRAGGKALPRRGTPNQRGIGGIRKLHYIAPIVESGSDNAQIQQVRVRSSRGKPASMRPGGRPGCCKIKKNF